MTAPEISLEWQCEPFTLRTAMIICICHGVSHRTIDKSIEDGAGSAGAVARQLGIGDCCGKCMPAVRQRLDTKRAEVSVYVP